MFISCGIWPHCQICLPMYATSMCNANILVLTARTTYDLRPTTDVFCSQFFHSQGCHVSDQQRTDLIATAFHENKQLCTCL